MKKSKENRCQCCNKTPSGTFHFVFDDEGKRQNIAQLLHDYIGKSLHEVDEIRYAICDPCWQQLIQYNDFKQKCIRANERTSDDDNDDNDELVNKFHEPFFSLEHLNNTLPNENENENEFEYENSEFLEEYQDDIDYVINVEYLEENYPFEGENNECKPELTKKNIPINFTTVFVKPASISKIG